MKNPEISSLIEDAVFSQKNIISLPAGTPDEDVRAALRDIMRQHPEFFWFSHQYSYFASNSLLYLGYNFPAKKRRIFEIEIRKVVDNYFQPLKLEGLNEFGKVAYVYKWIKEYTDYNPHSSFNQTVYSVLINRSSVCTGYAKTAQYLLGLIGIESKLVFGKFHKDPTDTGRHAWNIVRIDGNWYHVDFSLADPVMGYLLADDEKPKEYDGLLWNYFCKPTSYILKSRSIERPDDYPPCIGDIDKYAHVALIPKNAGVRVLKSDSGTQSQVFVFPDDKHSVIKDGRESSESLHREYEILRKLKGCKHVVDARELCDKGLVLENLTPWSELLASHYYRPDEESLRKILFQLSVGLTECLRHGIVFTDIHYNNVFVNGQGIFKWGDFGTAYGSDGSGNIPPEMIGENGIPFGSLWFMAPETYRRKIFTQSSAIYSMAMMAYFVMNGMRPPFWKGGGDDTVALQRKWNGDFIVAPSSAVFPHLAPLVCDILNSGDNPVFHSIDEFISALFNLNYVPRNPRSASSNQAPPSSCAPMPCHADDDFARPLASSAPVDSDVFVSTMMTPPRDLNPGVTHVIKREKKSIWKKIFSKKVKGENLYASVFAPSEVEVDSYFMVRAFIHRPEDSSRIESLLKDIDPKAVKKANKPLGILVSPGDKITAILQMTPGVSVENPIAVDNWHDTHLEFDFICRLEDITGHNLFGRVLIAVNDMPAGDLSFLIDIVEKKGTEKNTAVVSRKYSRIFISYAHADYEKVKGIAEGCRINGTDYFFDRHTLKAGDIFKDKIMEYIGKADLFVLCWSKNAAESEWVRLECEHAIQLIDNGKNLAIYPLSLPPEAPLPTVMAQKYHFIPLQ